MCKDWIVWPANSQMQWDEAAVCWEGGPDDAHHSGYQMCLTGCYSSLRPSCKSQLNASEWLKITNSKTIYVSIAFLGPWSVFSNYKSMFASFCFPLNRPDFVSILLGEVDCTSEKYYESSTSPSVSRVKI